MKKISTESSANCYSGGEAAFMNWSQRIRARLLAPHLAWMAGAGVRAGHITLLSLLCGLCFCPLYITGSYIFAFVMLAMHVLLDGIDGPLARHLGSDGDRGSFTDTLSDQVVVTVTTITLMYMGVTGAWSSGLYIFFYCLVVGFAIVRNALGSPYSWLLRPRFIIYLWLIVETYWWQGSLEMLQWVMVGILGVKSFSGFLAIRRRV